MDLTYTYIKSREDFGRQPMFCEVGPHLLHSIIPNTADQKKYCLRNPVHREIQACVSTSENYVNTPKVKYSLKSTNHSEGGWPKDINLDDEEATDRYRRRAVRDDDYVNTILNLTPKLKHLIDQNNALDLYEHYFTGIPEIEPIEKPAAKLSCIYKDSNNQTDKRPVACIDWTCGDAPKLVVAYSDKAYPPLVDMDFTCRVWNLENVDQALFEFMPPAECGQIACSPVSPDIIAGGLSDGRVCIFDIRENKSPVALSKRRLSHRDPVTALLFLQSRLGQEFFSGSSDGQCLWYDIRNISKPTESLIMSLMLSPEEEPSIENAHPVSVLQYDRAFPTRFLCGTETGFVINVNRKAKIHNDIMSAIFKAHHGPVKAVHRSPCTTQIFITCGDWRVHVWSENILVSPIITGTSQRHQIQDVEWAPYRVSGYMTVGDDGKFRYWDILRKLREPLIALSVAKCPLLRIKPHSEGRLVAMGDKKGSLYLVSLSESLVISSDRDKQIMLQTFEREARREHILENRVKELRLKAKGEMEAGAITIKEEDNKAQDKITAREYRRVVLEEFRNAGLPLPPKLERKR